MARASTLTAVATAVVIRYTLSVGEIATREETVIGRIVSDLRITAELGSGGMGTVYLAEEERLHRRVAVKFLAAQYASDDTMKERFIREAQAAAALSHPNIIPIYAVSEFEGRPYFSMEYVDGHTLQDVIADGPIPFEQIHDIITQVCKALRVAHEAGIVHRDIKPGNILMDSEGRVRLVDFGLARRVSDQHLTPVDSTIGTIAYTSPEQLRGEEPGPASDLFSVGVILYEMISGQRPFPGRYEAAVMYAIANDTPAPIYTLRKDVPTYLTGIATRLLEKRVADRYRAAADVLADLETRSDAAPVHAHAPATRSTRKRKLTYWLIVVAAIAVVAVGLRFVGWHADGGTQSRKMLAVLPFENLGPPEDEYFSDGVTDAITTHLWAFSNLGVISRSSSQQYKRSTKDVREIGAELGADYLLLGTVQWDKSGPGKRSRITASLVDAETGSYIYTNTYTPTPQELFSLEAEIGETVTRALKIAVKRKYGESSLDEPTADLKAYDLYLRGNDYFNRSGEPPDIRIALDLYGQAVARDAEFAEAYAMLSRGHCLLYSDNYDRTEERLRLAEKAARAALALDPDLPDAHLAMGYCYYAASEFAAAVEQFQIVRDIQPNNQSLYNAIAAVYRRQGDLQTAVRYFVRALELDPRSNQRAMDVALTYGLLQKFDTATQYADRAITLAPDWPLPYIYKSWLPILRDGDIAAAQAEFVSSAAVADLYASPYYWRIARIVEPSVEEALLHAKPGTDTVGYYLHCAQLCRLSGRHDMERSYADSARVRLEGQTEHPKGQARFHTRLGLAYCGLRQKDKALENGELGVRLWTTATDPIDAPFLIADFAEICVTLGEFDLALDQLERLATMPGFATAAYLKADPLWLPLHGSPRFQMLIHEPL